MPNWFVIQNESEQGPLSSDQLRKLVLAGQVRPEDLLRREDIPKRVRAGSVKGLFDANAADAGTPQESSKPLTPLKTADVPPIQHSSVPTTPPQVAMSIRGAPKRRFLTVGRLAVGVMGIGALLVLWFVVKPIAGRLTLSKTQRGEQPANAITSEPAARNSPAPLDSSAGTHASKDPSQEVFEWIDDNGSGVLFSDKLIPILYGVPKSILKEMPPDQLALFREMEKLAEEANRAVAEQGSNPVLRGRLSETILKKAAALTAEQDDISYRNLPQENPLKGWVGRIHLASDEAVVLMGRKSSINNEGLYYQLSLRRKNPPRTTYLASEHEAVVWIHIETDAMSDAAIAQFKNLKNGDWVKVDLPDAGWSSVQLVRFGEKDDGLKAVYGTIDIRERYAVRNRTRQPVIRKLIVSD